jgi:acyl-CoA synthetase (AMP-forming)/AMP-acid ligase II
LSGGPHSQRSVRPRRGPRSYRFGEVIAAVVELGDGPAPSGEEIADSVRGHLAGFKRPRHVVIVEKVKRGPNGKADYAWAKQLAADQAAG